MVVPAMNENDVEYRPPINRDAIKVQDVYSLDDIVSSEVLDSISEEADRVLNCEDDTE